LECIIIDPGCSSPSEEEELTVYIKSKDLTPVAQIITHYHIDHVLGVKFIKKLTGLELQHILMGRFSGI
jgi:hydroxyacylglutathione hydrolase